MIWDIPMLIPIKYGNCPQRSKERKGVSEQFCEMQCLLYTNCPRNPIIFHRQIREVNCNEKILNDRYRI